MAADDEVTYVGSWSVLPPEESEPSPGDFDSCALCASEAVAWVHPVDRDLASYVVQGEGRTLAGTWALCDRCERLHAPGDVDAVMTLMRDSAWSWATDDELRAALQAFRRADLGGRPTER
jgi:hypothetical protein